MEHTANQPNTDRAEPRAQPDGPGDRTPPPAGGGALWDLAKLFGRLGFTAFGGPAAHIAMMQEEVVRRRRWLDEQEFLDLLGATNLIPGPNSTELAIHIGHRRAGWSGLVVAGLSFITPAVLIVLAVAAVYVRLGRLPAVASAFYGVGPVMVAVVVHALLALARTAVKTRLLGVLGVLAVAAAMAGGDQLLILGSAAVLAAAFGHRRDRRRPGAPDKPTAIALLSPIQLSAAATVAAALPTSTSLFLIFAKIGSILFGSGYVLLAFLRAEFVQRRGWLTEGQLLDAIAVGQFTPGPVFTTATFIGYLLGRTAGALAATAGIFLPAFFFVAISGPLIPRLRRSPLAGAVLDGVNVASLALMAAVTWQLGRAALIDLPTAGIAIASFLALRYGRGIHSGHLVLAGALLGVLLRASPS
jgi:chromate transporter